jgi:hypothetical protein
VIQAQLLTIAVYGLIAWWYAAPGLNKLPRVQALTAILWVHVFRYCVLYIFVARREGYAISDVASTELVVGDLIGALLAMVAIVLFRLRSPLGLAATWLVVIATVGDFVIGFYTRQIEPPRCDAAGAWWLVFVYFAPAVLVSLPLLIWQLVSRRRAPLTIQA